MNEKESLQAEFQMVEPKKAKAASRSDGDFPVGSKAAETTC
jgi:hypothetical protein